MTKIANPVFILGSERSGTNLLRVLLSNHSGLHAPVSPHLLQSFADSAKYYTPLHNNDNSRRLFEDMLAIATHPYTGWTLNLNFDAVIEKYNPKCFFDYFNLFYLESTIANNKKRYVCKEIKIWNYIFQILAYYEEPGIIYIYRDPRDYVTSWMKKPMFIVTAYDALNNWIYEQDLIEALVNTHGIKVYPIKYEKLISDPERVMTGVLNHINVPPEDSCFSIDTEKGKSVAWNPYWENLSQPINKDNLGNFHNYLDFDTLNMIETRARYHMDGLGYPIETPANWTKSILTKYSNMFQRKLVMFKNREHIYRKMELLHGKIDLLNRLKQNASDHFYSTRNAG